VFVFLGVGLKNMKIYPMQYIDLGLDNLCREFKLAKIAIFDAWF
jgi:hypothetical protein